jgi:hypothetical protein
MYWNLKANWLQKCVKLLMNLILNLNDCIFNSISNEKCTHNDLDFSKFKYLKL